MKVPPFGRIMFAVVLALQSALPTTAFAADTPTTSVVIQSFTAGYATANDEYVALKNTTSSLVDLTGWTLKYDAQLLDTKEPSVKYEFKIENGALPLIAPGGTLVLVMGETTSPVRTWANTVTMTGANMANSYGRVVLYASDGAVKDSASWGDYWGTNPVPDGETALPKLLTATVYERTGSGQFVQATAKVPQSDGITRYMPPVDACPATPAFDDEIPPGYGLDATGTCYPTTSDVCVDTEVIDLVVPDGFTRNAENSTCEKIVYDKVLEIRELLANYADETSGIDTGHEFIELYNPGDEAVSLLGYSIDYGAHFSKSVTLDTNLVIEAHAYLSLSDAQTGLTLSNTGDMLRLRAPAGNVVSQTEPYVNPQPNESWALIDGVWQYTNQPTPGAENKTRYIAPAPVVEPEVAPVRAPCPAGSYRNPLTNRCRSIEQDAATLASCADGYYRNPDTNRCRKITLAAPSTLTPCDSDEFRNPATNRCKKIASTEDVLQDCAEGYERNPATNRCRKVLGTEASAGTVATQTQPLVTTAPDNRLSPWMWALVAVGASGAIGYGLFEWRTEIAQFGQKIVGRTGKK